MSDEGQTKQVVVVLHETMFQSVVKDLCTYGTIVAVIGTGWWLESEAMQWLGFIMLCISAIGRIASKNRNMTPQQAADMLWRKFGVKADCDCQRS